MRLLGRLLLVMLLVGAVAMPASAGTAADPEVTDPCPGQVAHNDDATTVTPAGIDICKGWFDTTPSGIKVSLEMAAPADATGGFWAMYWRSGDCFFQVRVAEGTGEETPRVFSAGCGEPPERECDELGLQCDDGDFYRAFNLPASSVVRNGKTLAISVDFTGELAEFAGAHDAGSVLEAPEAYSNGAVGPLYLSSFGCTFDQPVDDHCFSANGDGTAPGRDYVVGS